MAIRAVAAYASRRFWCRPRDHQHDQRGDDAERAGDKESRQIARQYRARQARAECCGRSAQLMPGKNPAEHQIGAFRPEPLRGEPHRRRHRCDPVEAVEHRKQRQAIEREVGERAGTAATGRAGRNTRTAASDCHNGPTASPRRWCRRNRKYPSRRAGSRPAPAECRNRGTSESDVPGPGRWCWRHR